MQPLVSRLQPPLDSQQHPAQCTQQLLVLLALVLISAVLLHTPFRRHVIFLPVIVAMRSSSARKIQRADRLLRVGFYDLERTLGKGNFAVVRLGVHRLTKTQVRKLSSYVIS